MTANRPLLSVLGALTLVAAAASVASVSFEGTSAGGQKYDWLQYQMDEEHTGNDTSEYVINSSNVAQLTQLFNTSFADAPDGQPRYLSDVPTAGGPIDMVFVTGEHGHTTAFNAATGAQVWQDNFAGSATGINNTAPAIDPNRQFLYAYGNDGTVHKVRVADGSEVTGGGWPEPVGSGKGSGQLTFATAKDGNTYLSVANNGQGHITTINLGTGSQHVFQTVCSSQPDIHGASCGVSGASPWVRAAGTYDPWLDRTFVGTGTNNGSGWIPGTEWRNSWLALPPDGHTVLQNGGGYPLDSYTATNWQAAVNSDADQMVGGLEILPHGAFPAPYQDVGVNCGKDSVCRLLNLANLSGQGGPGHVGGEIQWLPAPQMTNMRESGTVWQNPQDGSIWVFQPGHGGVQAIKIAWDAALGKPQMSFGWQLNNGRHTTTIVANNIVFSAAGGGEHTTTQPVHAVEAIDPTTGKILWSGPIDIFHWASPIVDNGVVYMVYGNSGGFGSGATANLVAWHLPSGVPTPTAPASTPSPSPTAPTCSPTPTSPAGVTVSASGGGQAVVSWTAATTCVTSVEYAVYVYCASGTTQFTTIAGTSATITGLPQNVYCTATVTGYSTGWSAWSAWAAWDLIT